jgi:hypothetical protein
MPGDIPFLERLAQLPAVPATAVATLIEQLADPPRDPVIGPLLSVDDEGDTLVSPLVVSVVQQFREKAELTCYAALVEGLTGVWNASVRAAVVARLRASGLPADDLLLRLQALSPTLGFVSGSAEASRAWLGDPFTQDVMLVQQCLVRILLSLRALAETRASELTGAEGQRRPPDLDEPDDSRGGTTP